MKTTFYIAFFLLICSCDEKTDCLKSQGEFSLKTLDIDTVERVVLNSAFELEIISDNNQELTMEGGINSLENIDLDYQSQSKTLILTDLNACAVLKGRRKITIRLKSPFIKRIDNLGSGSRIYSGNILKTKEMRFTSTSSSSEWNLEFDNNQVEIIGNDLSLFNLRGKTLNLFASITSSDTRIDGSVLSTVNCFVYHNGSNDILVNPSDYLEVVITSTGNVVNKSETKEIILENAGRGRFIQD